MENVAEAVAETSRIFPGFKEVLEEPIPWVKCDGCPNVQPRVLMHRVGQRSCSVRLAWVATISSRASGAIPRRGLTPSPLFYLILFKSPFMMMGFIASISVL